MKKQWSEQETLTVRISGMNVALLSVQGIVDIGNTKLNGAGSNLSVGPYEIPVFGGVDCG